MHSKAVVRVFMRCYVTSALYVQKLRANRYVLESLRIPVSEHTPG